ncbi:MAG: hypothetical protein M1820_006025 [Bogoriella megaspora]|nr:MAG: hypothetical protein M1820_006025 [Bogoriella megaspora]
MEGGETPEIGTADVTRQAHENPSKSTVACLRCRDQKLKCNRELPCSRCQKQNALCRYPNPPDRKRIAQRTSRKKALRPDTAEHVHRLESSPTETRIKEGPHVATDQDDHDGSIVDAGEADLPSTEVGLLLLEIYFKRLYNATLLFHRNIAFQLYMEDKIPQYLLRAIFAHAAVFLEQIDSPYVQYLKVVPMQTVFVRSWSWARSASREVLSRADEPSLPSIQTLQVLQNYYFSRGEIRRAIVHASLAYSLSQLLGYDKLYEDDAVPLINRGAQFDREMKRRCFWACWVSVCVGGEQTEYSKACGIVTDLPLPGRLEKGGSVRGLNFVLGQKMDDGWNVRPGALASTEIVRSPATSLMAEFVKLLGVWTKVQAFISGSLALTEYERANQIDELEELSDTMERSMFLPTSDLISHAEKYDESPELLISACSLHYLSRILTHASMVPILGGRPVHSAALKQSVRENAKMALQQTIELAKQLHQFVKNHLDPTRLWPFTGYAAFVAGSVFMKAAVPAPPLFTQEPKTDVQQAAKLNTTIEAGSCRDADLITSSAYPWDARYAGCSLDHHDNTTRDPQKSNPYIPLSGTPHVANGIHPSNQPAQDFNRYRTADQSDRAPQQLTQPRASFSGLPAPTLAYQHGSSTSLEDMLMYDNESRPLETSWWSTTPSMDQWDYPASANEVHERVSMS